MNGLLDYYKILGVPEKATRRQIQRAYRELAKRYHPDSQQSISTDGSAAPFCDIATAYHVLSNPDLRQAYDSQHRSRSSEFHDHRPTRTSDHRAPNPFAVWQGPRFPITPYGILNIFLGSVKLLLMVILMITPFLIPFILLFFYFRLFRP